MHSMNPHLTIQDIPAESINEFFRVKQELQKQQYLDDRNNPANSKNGNKDELGENASEYGSSALSKIDGNRKSKKDNKRDFHCGCGKSYLSYPALYTHIKTKHSGKMPEGTQNSSCNNNRRGRPRRNNDEPVMKNEEAKEKKIEDMTAIYQKMVVESDLKILEVYNIGKGVCEDFANCFPTYKSATGIEPHPLCAIIKGIQNKTLREEIGSEACFDNVVGVYLWCLSKLLSPSFYRTVSIFYRALRECLNEYGYSLLEDFKMKPENSQFEIFLRHSQGRKTDQQCFATTEPPAYIAVIGEYFILKYLPQHVPQFDQTFAVYLLMDFCNWLRRRGLSKIKLDLQHYLSKDRPIGDYIRFKEHKII